MEEKKEHLNYCCQAFNMVTDQIALIDTKYKYLYANNAYLYAHNRKLDEIVGEHIEHIIGDDAFRDIVKPQLDACYRGEEVNYKNWVKFKRSKFRYVEVTNKALRDEHDQISAIAIYYKDLTDIQQLELSLKESRQIISQISTTDWLTELYNRNYFNDYFPKMLKTSQRNNQLLAFGLIDVDHFKTFNDEHGQSAADSALLKISGVLRDTLKRPNDYIFRFEYDQFAVLFNVNQDNDAKYVAEKIQKNVEALRIENSNGTNIPVITVSIGMTLLYPDETYMVENVHRSVEKLLNTAKKEGKNRACFS